MTELLPLELTIGTLTVVAPQATHLPPGVNVVADDRLYQHFISQIQKVRGACYTNDGALPPSALDEQGRHISALDNQTWHVTLTNEIDQVHGCARMSIFPLVEGPPDICRLHTHDLIVRMGERDQHDHLIALNAFLSSCLTRHPFLIETTGWAVLPEYRNSVTGTALIVSIWSYGRLLGGTSALGTATVRHNSARLLSKIGGGKLKAGDIHLDAVFDPLYNCDMQILTFDSNRLNATLEPVADYATSALLSARYIVPLHNSEDRLLERAMTTMAA